MKRLHRNNKISPSTETTTLSVHDPHSSLSAGDEPLAEQWSPRQQWSLRQQPCDPSHVKIPASARQENGIMYSGHSRRRKTLTTGTNMELIQCSPRRETPLHTAEGIANYGSGDTDTDWACLAVKGQAGRSSRAQSLQINSSGIPTVRLVPVFSVSTKSCRT